MTNLGDLDGKVTMLNAPKRVTMDGEEKGHGELNDGNGHFPPMNNHYCIANRFRGYRINDYFPGGHITYSIVYSHFPPFPNANKNNDKEFTEKYLNFYIFFLHSNMNKL